MIIPDELNDDIKNILGRVGFTVTQIARVLDKAGLYKVERKAESEQAAALHWMLSLYAKYGRDWAKEGDRILVELQTSNK